MAMEQKVGSFRPHTSCLVLLVLSLVSQDLADSTVWDFGLYEGNESFPEFYHSSQNLRTFVTELAAPGPGHCPGLRLVRSVFPLSSKGSESVPVTELKGEDAQTYVGAPSDSVLDAIFIKATAMSSEKPPVRYALFFGEHGRELISAEMGMYLLKAFCGRRDVVSEVRRRAQLLLSYAEVLILPNVDEGGRRSVEEGRFCMRGTRDNFRQVDLNRNWDYRWSPDDQENYPGPHPFSEPETQIARKHLESFKPNVFLSVHSGNRALWTPGAYDYDDSEARKLMGAAWNTLLHIASHVNRHTHCKCNVGAPGKIAHVRHPGTSLDYAGLKMNVPYAMAWETWLDPKGDCLKRFSPVVEKIYSRVLQQWSLAMVYFAESAAAALRGIEPAPVLAHAHAWTDDRYPLEDVQHHKHRSFRRIWPQHLLSDTEESQALKAGAPGDHWVWMDLQARLHGVPSVAVVAVVVLLCVVIVCLVLGGSCNQLPLSRKT